jgi:hypothetical protein
VLEKCRIDKQCNSDGKDSAMNFRIYTVVVESNLERHHLSRLKIFLKNVCLIDIFGRSVLKMSKNSCCCMTFVNFINVVLF